MIFSADYSSQAVAIDSIPKNISGEEYLKGQRLALTKPNEVALPKANEYALKVGESVLQQIRVQILALVTANEMHFQASLFYTYLV